MAMIGLLDGLKMGAAAIAAASLVYGAMTLHIEWVVKPAVFAAGRAVGTESERKAWETLRDEMLRAASAKLKQAQDKIDAAEQKYFRDRTGDALKILALEESIKEANDNAQDDGRTRPPAFSRGVSRSLNAIGR